MKSNTQRSRDEDRHTIVTIIDNIEELPTVEPTETDQISILGESINGEESTELIGDLKSGMGIVVPITIDDPPNLLVSAKKRNKDLGKATIPILKATYKVLHSNYSKNAKIKQVMLVTTKDDGLLYEPIIKELKGRTKTVIPHLPKLFMLSLKGTSALDFGKACKLFLPR
ncbi:unnamed protein product [Dovyalis caffra]|uniref:Uncharacterized protein n=1 Tax=Dovyalis caffra TaxID=77055 RepID=A0AAV1SS51_9ROSI|nr:unnamed protein product [Dovyalis caffra]